MLPANMPPPPPLPPKSSISRPEISALRNRDERGYLDPLDNLDDLFSSHDGGYGSIRSSESSGDADIHRRPVPSRYIKQPTRYVCDIQGCSKAFGSNATLTGHKKYIHFTKPILPCPCDLCGATFADDPSLRRHRIVHRAIHRTTSLPEIHIGNGNERAINDSRLVSIKRSHLDEYRTYRTELENEAARLRCVILKMEDEGKQIFGPERDARLRVEAKFENLKRQMTSMLASAKSRGRDEKNKSSISIDPASSSGTGHENPHAEKREDQRTFDRESQMKEDFESKLANRDDDHQAALKHLRGAENMLSKMKQELQRLEGENEQLNEKLRKDEHKELDIGRWTQECISTSSVYTKPTTIDSEEIFSQTSTTPPSSYDDHGLPRVVDLQHELIRKTLELETLKADHAALLSKDAAQADGAGLKPPEPPVGNDSGDTQAPNEPREDAEIPSVLTNDIPRQNMELDRALLVTKHWKPVFSPKQLYAETMLGEGRNIRPGPSISWTSKLLRSVSRVLRSQVPSGYTRMEWTCSCGHQMYGDYIGPGMESFCRKLENMQYKGEIMALGHSIAMESVSRPANPCSDASVSATAVHHIRAASTSTSSNKSESGSENPSGDLSGSSSLTQISSSTSISLPSSEIAPIQSYLELCVNRNKYLTRIGEIPLVDARGKFLVQSDCELFAKIKARYNELSRTGFLRYLYRPHDIRFVQFGIRRGVNQAGIYNRQADEIPPEVEVREGRYHYYECPLPQMPPMDKRTFFHYFWAHAKHGPTNDMTFHDRLPKKLGCSILMASSSTPLTMGWGIHIIEGPNWPIFPWVVVVLLSMTLVICAAYDAIVQDRESGFTIGQLLFSILMAVLSSVISYVVDTV